MVKRIALAAVILTGGYAQLNGQAADTPEQRLRAYLVALATEDPQVVETWARGNLLPRRDAEPSRFAAQVVMIHQDWGSFELDSIEPVRENGELVGVVALGYATSEDRWYRLNFSLGPGPQYLLDRHFIGRGSPPASRPDLRLSEPSAGRWFATRLAELEASSGFSGGLAIALGGDVVVAEFAGWRDRDAGERLDAATRFNLGSTSKLFTAVAVLRLAERGLLDLDEPIGSYLTDYPDRALTDVATTRHLLTHRSGLGDFWDARYEAEWSTITTHDQLVPHIRRAPRTAAPGERFAYSNSGYALAGLVVEAVTGYSFYEVVRREVFEPAGMVSTSYPNRHLESDDLAVPYGPAWTRAREGARGSAAGGAYATLPDMHRFARALWSGELVSDASLELMRTPAWETEMGARYGLGLFVNRNTFDMLEESHGGVGPGTLFNFTYLPEVDVMFVLAANHDSGGFQDLIDTIRRLAAEEIRG